MKINKENLLTSPLKLLSNLETTVYDLIETFTWGKAGKQSIVTLDDLQHWFNELPTSVKKKTYYGVIARIREIDTENIRILQGVFDKKEKCLLARHIVAGEISDDLEKGFGTTDLLIFSTEQDFESKYLHH